MKNKLLIFLLAIVINIVLINSTQAQSYYGSGEFGFRSYTSDAHAIGMGENFIAVTDGFQINMNNPAGLVFTPVTRLSGDFLHEAIWSESQDGTGFAKYTNFNGLSLAIPIKIKKFVTAFSLHPVSQFDYRYEVDEKIDDYSYTKKTIAKGGLNKLSAGIGISPFKSIAIGAAFNYYFAKFEKTWELDFVSDLFWDTSDNLTRKMWGYNFTTGMIINALPGLFVGGFYTKDFKLNSQDQVKNSVKFGSIDALIQGYDHDELNIFMPELWGFGISYIFKTKYRISSDYYTEPWSKIKVNGTLLQGYNDGNHIGVGFEILPSPNTLANYFQKISYRMGYFHKVLNYLDGQGNTISENGFTLGFGFPYYNTLGRLDIALKYSNRGDLSKNPVKENVFQMFISITGGEKWFFRGEQR
jgi:hypothetical protein